MVVDVAKGTLMEKGLHYFSSRTGDVLLHLVNYLVTVLIIHGSVNNQHAAGFSTSTNSLSSLQASFTLGSPPSVGSNNTVAPSVRSETTSIATTVLTPTSVIWSTSTTENGSGTQTSTVRNNVSTTLLSSLFSTSSVVSNENVSPVVTVTQSSMTVGATVIANQTRSSTHATTLDLGGQELTTTPPIEFGNSSCSGNDTGCPEYHGKNSLKLSTPAIVGIAVGSAVFVIILVCLLICCLRKRHTLSGSKADLSSYWDDNVTLSYINGHLDVPKDLNDEMISLDNDSFLNSLDSMSFTNIWAADSAKHTNF